MIAGGPDRFRRMTTPMIRIADPGDDRLADYRELRDADLRGTRRLFTVESERVLARFLDSGWRPESVLVEAEVAERLHARLEVLGADIPVYVAEPGALREISGYGFHGGALALGSRRQVLQGLEPVESLLARRRVTFLAAEGVVHVDNMGALFRNASSLGAEGVLLSPDCSDPLLRKSIRISTGRVFQVPWAICDPWPGTIDLLRQDHGFRVIGLENTSGASDIEGMEYADRCVLLVGAEGSGLREATLQLCDQVLEIPGIGDDQSRSLNVAVASAIGLHEVGRRRRRADDLDLGS